ncbi:hypothetical protein [Priestia megaterium]
MKFKEFLPEWRKEGKEPPELIKNKGWNFTDPLINEWMNWFQYRTYASLKELQENSLHKVDFVQKMNTMERGTRDIIFVSEFKDDVIGGDWSPVMNKIFSFYSDSTSPYYRKRIKVIFDSNVTYTIKSTVTINPKWASVDMRGSKIQTNGLGIQGFLTALRIDSQETYANDFNSQVLHLGIYLVGEGKSIPGSVGIEYVNTAGAKFIGMRVSNFESNIYILDNSYLLTWDHCNFSHAVYAVHIPAGRSNYGERLTFIDSNLGNSDYSLLNNNSQGGVHLEACSLDFTNKGIIKSQGGTTFLNNCHIEFNTEVMEETPFQVSGNGATLIVRGGVLLAIGTLPLNNYIVEGDGYSLFEGIKMHNLKTTTKQFASNKGVHEVIIGNTNNQHSFGFTKIASSHNTFIDGSFEFESILDLIWISADTDQISNRFKGQNVQISLDTKNYNSGNKSLKITKMNKNGINSPGAVSMALPLLKFDPKRKYPFIEWSMAKLNDNGVGGKIGIYFEWVNLMNTSDMKTPLILKVQSVSQTTYNINNKESKNWMKFNSNGNDKILYNPPLWATHILIRFNFWGYDGDNGNASINLDDLFFEMA